MNAAQNDYHIGAGSAAIDKAIDDTITKDDIDGDVRPFGGGFDIGADEATPNLTIAKSGPYLNAGLIPYTITVTNTGAATATNLLITDSPTQRGDLQHRRDKGGQRDQLYGQHPGSEQQTRRHL